MKLLLKNIKENYNKEEKQEGDNFLTLKKVAKTLDFLNIDIL